MAKQDWILNPIGCGYRAGLESAMGERERSLRVAVDTYGREIQPRMVASGLGLGLVPRSVLRASVSRDEITIVDAAGFAMQLDIWLVHLREFGNLKRAIETLTATVADGFAATPPSSAGERVHADLAGFRHGAPPWLVISL